MIRAGEMRFQVEIERRSTTQDAAGEPLLTWELVLRRRAAVQRTPGKELWVSDQRQGRVPTVFRLRYPRELDTPVGPQMRLTWGSRVFEILSAIDPTGLQEELVITAEELLEAVP